MAEKQATPLTHPALRPRKKLKKLNDKTRSTTVRVAKLINAVRIDNEAGSPTYGEVKVSLIQVPIEPSHNNAGTLADPTIPLRHYLEKGFEFPHEFDGEKYPGIYCAVKDCWDWAEVTTDQENGSERCPEHEDAYRAGTLRYATSAKNSRG